LGGLKLKASPDTKLENLIPLKKKYCPWSHASYNSSYMWSISRTVVQIGQGKKLQNPTWKFPKAKRPGGVVQAVEHLPRKFEALSSTSILPPSTKEKFSCTISVFLLLYKQGAEMHIALLLVLIYFITWLNWLVPHLYCNYILYCNSTWFLL
jgi:hypothetical protein